jgi:hypothetical protein
VGNKQGEKDSGEEGGDYTGLGEKRLAMRREVRARLAALDLEIARVLDAAAQDRFYSQDNVADIIGTSRQRLDRILKGVTALSYAEVIALVEHYELPPSMFCPQETPAALQTSRRVFVQVEPGETVQVVAYSPRIRAAGRRRSGRVTPASRPSDAMSATDRDGGLEHGPDRVK